MRPGGACFGGQACGQSLASGGGRAMAQNDLVVRDGAQRINQRGLNATRCCSFISRCMLVVYPLKGGAGPACPSDSTWIPTVVAAVSGQ